MQVRGQSMKTSVVLCTYNSAAYIRAQLDSILRQSRPVDEILIGDDLSTDSTGEILAEYAARNPGLFQLFFHPIQLGTIANYNFLLPKASGSGIFLSDHDDVWVNNKVEAMMKIIEADEKCLMLFSDGSLIDSVGRPIEGSLWSNYRFGKARQIHWRVSNGRAVQDLSHNNNTATGATVMLRRCLLDGILPIEAPPNYWHDCYLALHAACRNGLRFTSAKLIKYRIHGSQQVGLLGAPPPKNTKTIELPDFLSKMRRLYPRYKSSIGGRSLVYRMKTEIRPVLRSNRASRSIH